jgi:hypothetical protein
LASVGLLPDTAAVTLGSPQARLPLDEPSWAFVVPRRRITIALATIGAVLALCSVAVTWLRLVAGRDHVLGLSALLDLNHEGNLPTWFEGSLFLVAALVAGVIAALERAARRPDSLRWSALAATILFLSLDEVAGVHEHLSVSERFLGQYGSIHNFTWVFVGIVLMGGVAGLFLRFVLRLPARTRNGILLAGALFVTGAAGFEVIGGLWALDHGEANLVYAAFVTIEESLEFAAAIVLLDTLLGQLGTFARWRGEVT